MIRPFVLATAKPDWSQPKGVNSEPAAARIPPGHPCASQPSAGLWLGVR